MKRGRDYNDCITKFIQQYTDIWKENKKLKEDIQGYKDDLQKVTNYDQILTCGTCFRVVWLHEEDSEVVFCKCFNCGFIDCCAYCDNDIDSKDLLEYQCVHCKNEQGHRI